MSRTTPVAIMVRFVPPIFVSQKGRRRDSKGASSAKLRRSKCESCSCSSCSSGNLRQKEKIDTRKVSLQQTDGAVAVADGGLGEIMSNPVAVADGVNPVGAADNLQSVELKKPMVTGSAGEVVER